MTEPPSGLRVFRSLRAELEAAVLPRAMSLDGRRFSFPGRIASHPARMRFGARVAPEGGADVPATWARGAPR
jgi:hypothetical protein